MAVIESHRAWELRTACEVDEYDDNQLTVDEQAIVLGLAWDCDCTGNV